jgi:dimethylargininase
VVSVPATFAAQFVRNDAEPLRQVLVVRTSPAIASVPPVYGESSAIAERALEQQSIFQGRLAAHGISVNSIDPGEDAPLQALSADSAVMFAQGAFLMRPSDVRQRRVIAAVEAALRKAQIPIVGRIAAPGLLDGGDVLLAGDTMYVGSSRARQSEVGIPVTLHGNALGREQLTAYARSTGLKVVEVALSGQARRLRSVASLVTPETVLLAPRLVDAAAFAGLQLLEAPAGEDYAAGVLALGNRRVLANLRFRQTIPLLRKAKIAVDAIDLWEFGKIGATPNSLVLALRRG